MGAGWVEQQVDGHKTGGKGRGEREDMEWRGRGEREDMEWRGRGEREDMEWRGRGERGRQVRGCRMTGVTHLYWQLPNMFVVSCRLPTGSHPFHKSLVGSFSPLCRSKAQRSQRLSSPFSPSLWTYR